MNKKTIMLTAVLAAVMMFSSCGKDKTNDEITQPSQSQSQTNETTQDGESAKTNGTKDSDNSSSSSKQSENNATTDDKNTADDGVGVSAEEFEDLVDTFNNTQNEEEKEQARKKIQSILEKAEQQ